MVRTASLQQRLVDTSTTSNNTDGSTGRARDGLLRARGETDTGLVVVGGVADNGSVVSRCPGEGTSVANLLLNVADDGTFRALADGEDVADDQAGLFAAVDEGAGVHAFGGDESLLAELVPVGVAEDDTGEGSTTGYRGIGSEIRLESEVISNAHRPASWMISFTIPRM